MPELKCVGCGKMFTVTKTEVARGRKYCTNTCYQERRIRNGFIHSGTGYRHVWDGTKYVAEHRLVVESAIGRKLVKGEEVHHIDGNRLNNTIDNLEIFSSKSEHRSAHCAVRHTQTYRDVVCHECGKPCSIKLSRYKKNKSGRFYCSLDCALKNRTLTMKFIWEQRRQRGCMKYPFDNQNQVGSGHYNV